MDSSDPDEHATASTTEDSTLARAPAAGEAPAAKTLDQAIAEVLESETPGMGLHIRRGGRTATLQRTNNGHPALWVCALGQQPALTTAEREGLQQAGLRSVPGSRTDLWWRAPTRDLDPKTWLSAVHQVDAAFLRGADGRLQWDQADLSTGCGTIVGIAVLVVVWVGLTAAGVWFEVPGIYDAFEWMGGTTRLKTAGGLAAIVTFFVVAIPMGVVAWLATRLFPGPETPPGPTSPS